MEDSPELYNELLIGLTHLGNNAHYETCRFDLYPGSNPDLPFPMLDKEPNTNDAVSYEFKLVQTVSTSKILKNVLNS